MFSPRLLEIPRGYWHRARPAGEWLFAGMIPGRHLCRNTPAWTCWKARRAAGLAKRITPDSLRRNAESSIFPSCLPRMGRACPARHTAIGLQDPASKPITPARTANLSIAAMSAPPCERRCSRVTISSLCRGWPMFPNGSIGMELGRWGVRSVCQRDLE